MRVGGPDRGGGTVSERVPARSQSVPAAVRWICSVPLGSRSSVPKIQEHLRNCPQLPETPFRRESAPPSSKWSNEASRGRVLRDGYNAAEDRQQFFEECDGPAIRARGGFGWCPLKLLLRGAYRQRSCGSGEALRPQHQCSWQLLLACAESARRVCLGHSGSPGHAAGHSALSFCP